MLLPHPHHKQEKEKKKLNSHISPFRNNFFNRLLLERKLKLLIFLKECII